MVEAAIIFPLVIGAVVAVIYITVGLYSALSLQTSIHLSLRKETGILSDTIERYQTAKTYEYQRQDDRWLEGIVRHSAILMEEEQIIHMNGLFRANVKRQEKGSAYIIDEAELVRYMNVSKEVLQ
ncbi:MAG: hypothetical protein K0R19_1591 [Bacillota bacterium]|jgi:hypothetical protein|nr:hypothetical protein [Bacillota bacterium]